MTMSLSQQTIVIAAVVLGTVLTRVLPFLLFPPGKGTPEFVRYLGGVLPSAALGLLVIYCYRNLDLAGGNRGIPELLSSAVVVGLHLWKKSMVLSIAGGTIFHMAVVQMFPA